MKRFSAAADINAPVEAVWRVLADIGQWPDWDPNTTKATGIVAKDATLNFTFAYADSRSIDVRITAADEPFLLEWSGGNAQMTGVRTHRITPREEMSRIEVSQVFSGPAAEQANLPDLDKPFRTFVEALKARVEAAA